jgi:hypothetical protein
MWLAEFNRTFPDLVIQRPSRIERVNEVVGTWAMNPGGPVQLDAIPSAQSESRA